MKAIVFDFDGTLTNCQKGSNCWYEIWKYIDDLEYNESLYNKISEKKLIIKNGLTLYLKDIKKRMLKENIYMKF